jgi:Zn-dependent protease with chaperone function
MVLLGWLQLVFILLVAGVFAGASLTAIAHRRWLGRLQTIAPSSRFVLLSALALLPLAIGVLVVAIAFAPSVLDALGLVADHCAHHGGHAFHLCFVHGHPPDVSALVLGSSVILSLWFLAAGSDEFSQLRQARSWGKTLLKLGRYDKSIGAWELATERPIAAAIGLFHPKVCVSGHLRELLSEQQFQAVLAHERTHVRRRDSLLKLVVRLCSLLHFPWVRTRLVEELDLSCEQSCDEAAADAVGNRLTVAEAILAVERACTTGQTSKKSMEHEPPAAALSFGAHGLERRVKSMLDGAWERPRWLSITVGAAAVLGAIAVSYNLLHHTAETLLSHVF